MLQSSPGYFHVLFWNSFYFLFQCLSVSWLILCVLKEWACVCLFFLSVTLFLFVLSGMKLSPSSSSHRSQHSPHHPPILIDIDIGDGRIGEIAYVTVRFSIRFCARKETCYMRCISSYFPISGFTHSVCGYIASDCRVHDGDSVRELAESFVSAFRLNKTLIPKLSSVIQVNFFSCNFYFFKYILFVFLIFLVFFPSYTLKDIMIMRIHVSFRTLYSSPRLFRCCPFHQGIRFSVSFLFDSAIVFKFLSFCCYSFFWIGENQTRKEITSSWRSGTEYLKCFVRGRRLYYWIYESKWTLPPSQCCCRFWKEWWISSGYWAETL